MKKRSLVKGYRDNFDTLCRAVKNGDIALMDCTDKQTGKPVAVVCAVQREDNGDCSFVPIAKMFDGNPYEEVLSATEVK